MTITNLASKKLSAFSLLCILVLGVGLSACKEKGPLERAGEEVDEAIDTAKSGKESLSSKVDDAVDDVREGTHDAVEELKK